MPTAYVTAPPSAAEEIARDLVESRLAACVNRLPCVSTYRWEGTVHEDDEVLLLAKTTDRRFPALVERVERSHPYDVPCVERFEEDDCLDPFRAWRDAAVEPDAGAADDDTGADGQ
jgi:periplasmic divalent cation tolerance protein